MINNLMEIFLILLLNKMFIGVGVEGMICYFILLNWKKIVLKDFMLV